MARLFFMILLKFWIVSICPAASSIFIEIWEQIISGRICNGLEQTAEWIQYCLVYGNHFKIADLFGSLGGNKWLPSS